MNKKISLSISCKGYNEKSSENDDYNFEAVRLKTFVSWPSNYPVNPVRLAKSGFYYTGNEDEVICFSCYGRLSHWQYGDIAHKRHMEIYPNCDFINNKSNNIPLNVNKKVREGIQSINNCNNLSWLKEINVDQELSVVYSEKMGKEKNLTEPKVIYDKNMFKMLYDSKEMYYVKMRSEEERLRTFKCQWPSAAVNPEELAKAGFFYLGQDDKVQCAFCRGIVKNWGKGDIPIAEHTYHFPSCKFVLKKNIVQFADKDTCFKVKCESHNNYDDMNSVSTDLLKQSYKLIDKSQQHTDLEELGVKLYEGPVHAEQATYEARLRTFRSWSDTFPVKKEDLAAAGFFYIGISDHTKCFHCDGGLCSWETGDDPWIEHGRWFRNCKFVRLNKGENFTKLCVIKHPATKTFETENESSAEFATQSDYYHKSDSLLSKVEESMKSSIITAILKTKLFPLHLIKAAIIRQLKETGVFFSNINEVCEAVTLLKNHYESENHHINSEEIIQPVQSNSTVSIRDVSSPGIEKPDSPSVILKEIDCTIKKTSQDICKMKNLEEPGFLNDQYLCKVCMDNEVGIVFLPCGHMLVCTLCAPALKDCPMCRKNIQATVRAYLP